jgi:hypothetical protein
MNWNQIGVQITVKLLPVIALLLMALISLGAAYIRKKSKGLESVKLLASFINPFTLLSK